MILTLGTDNTPTVARAPSASSCLSAPNALLFPVIVLAAFSPPCSVSALKVPYSSLFGESMREKEGQRRHPFQS